MLFGCQVSKFQRVYLATTSASGWMTCSSPANTNPWQREAPSVFAVPRGLLVSCFVNHMEHITKFRTFIIRWRTAKVKDLRPRSWLSLWESGRVSA